jgi:hypothetical protein
LAEVLLDQLVERRRNAAPAIAFAVDQHIVDTTFEKTQDGAGYELATAEDVVDHRAVSHGRARHPVDASESIPDLAHARGYHEQIGARKKKGRLLTAQKSALKPPADVPV